MNPIISAPIDGTRILLKYTVMHYGQFGWYEDGEKWEECLWDATRVKGFGETKGAWVPWCGNRHTHSTQTITKPLGWLPLP